MASLSEYMSRDHNRCDDLFAEAENAVDSGDWGRAQTAFDRFRSATLRHFALEDDILFPFFEERTGMTAGPTAVMRSEHAQMTEVIGLLARAVQTRDADTYLGYGESLLMLLRQHNIKEEQILYPMIDRVGADDSQDMLDRLDRVPA